jgi:hypothetical protein
MKMLEIQQFILACPMCMSGTSSEGKVAQAANSAILLLFLVLCGVLMTFVSFILYLAKRARLAAEEDSLLPAVARLDASDRPAAPSETR